MKVMTRFFTTTKGIPSTDITGMLGQIGGQSVILALTLRLIDNSSFKCKTEIGCLKNSVKAYKTIPNNVS